MCELTSAQQTSLLQAVESGVSPYVAGSMLGLDVGTIRRILTRGRDGIEPWASLVVQIDRAVARSISRWVGNVDTAAAEDWRAAAWLLERRFPKKFGRDRGEKSSGGAITVEFIRPAPDPDDPGDDIEG